MVVAKDQDMMEVVQIVKEDQEDVVVDRLEVLMVEQGVLVIKGNQEEINMLQVKMVILLVDLVEVDHQLLELLVVTLILLLFNGSLVVQEEMEEVI
jgi:glycerol-3-phosphate O-acyltransferase